MSSSGAGVPIGGIRPPGAVSPSFAAAFFAPCFFGAPAAGVGDASGFALAPMSQVTEPEPDALAAAEFMLINRFTRVVAPGFSKIVSLFMIIAIPAPATAK